MQGWRSTAIGYGLLGLLGALLAVALRDTHPWEYPGAWLRLGSTARIATSLVLGLLLAIAVVSSTRVAVRRWRWAQRLYTELQPVARSLTPSGVVALAVLSSAGEELFFRGLLAPLLGVIGQAVLFGLAHQLRGPSRWVWVAWATAVGLALGAIFALTGSLTGPLLAHALINATNLRFLRADRASPPRKRRLGGILASSDV